MSIEHLATAKSQDVSTCLVLVVDDEPTSREFALEVLRRAGYRVAGAGDGGDAMRTVEAERPDVVLCDLMMPGVGGLQFLEWAHEHVPEMDVIIMTAHGEIPTAVHCMRLGAFDYITKPFPAEQLLHLVGRALERRALLRQTRELRRQLDAEKCSQEIVGRDPAIDKLRQRIGLVADSDVNVLVTGETGTGKELVARALHRAGPRHARPFVAVNCAALPEALIASELFGHERGAFTTAVRTHVGRFETADGGTMLLDEIGDLPLSIQGTLLRVLQEKRFERVGSTRALDADVRVVAATRQDLGQAVREGRFREDLYYRINVIHLACPPLRERRGDIPLLAEHILERLGAPGAQETRLSIARPAMLRLRDYHWPGNVRELENVLARAAVLARGREIDAEDLEFTLEIPGASAAPQTLRLECVERDHVRRVLELNAWNRSEAARVLGIDRGTLQRKMARYRLLPPRT